MGAQRAENGGLGFAVPAVHREVLAEERARRGGREPGDRRDEALDGIGSDADVDAPLAEQRAEG
jgi:hypothetical protein